MEATCFRSPEVRFVFFSLWRGKFSMRIGIRDTHRDFGSKNRRVAGMPDSLFFEKLKKPSVIIGAWYPCTRVPEHPSTPVPQYPSTRVPEYASTPSKKWKSPFKTINFYLNFFTKLFSMGIFDFLVFFFPLFFVLKSDSSGVLINLFVRFYEKLY